MATNHCVATITECIGESRGVGAMNNRDVFLLVIVEQALAMGILLFEVWVLTRKGRKARQMPEAPMAKAEAGPPQPYLVSVNRTPWPVEQSVPLGRADDDCLAGNAERSA